MGEMEVNTNVSDKNAEFVLNGVFSMSKYHEFVITLTNIAKVEEHSWVFNFSQLKAPSFQLIMICIVLNNYVKKSNSVKFILPEYAVAGLKWFDPVWTSRIKYEVSA